MAAVTICRDFGAQKNKVKKSKKKKKDLNPKKINKKIKQG